MNILYIAFVDFSKKHYGPVKKIVSACKSLSRNNDCVLIGRNDSDTVIVNSDGTFTTIAHHEKKNYGKYNVLIYKKNQMNDIIEYAKDKKIDLCYIRFDLCTISFLSFLEKLKKSCSKIFIEIATYPYHAEYKGLINKFRLTYDSLCNRFIKKYVDRIVSFYKIKDDEFFGIKVLNVPNGCDFNAFNLIKCDEIPSSIDMVAVSTMRNWHGYERMIEGLYNYYTNGGQRNVIFHLIGSGPDEQKYRTMTEKFMLEEHVKFYGAQSGKNLDDILERMTIGVDSLARHRTGINMLSSLKSREYGAKGLPIINSCSIDIIDDDYEYFLKVPADESPIDINDIVKFYDRVYHDNNRREVKTKIRYYISSKSDMSKVMEMVLAEAACIE